jgi:hypothetical protein
MSIASAVMSMCWSRSDNARQSSFVREYMCTSTMPAVGSAAS